MAYTKACPPTLHCYKVAKETGWYKIQLAFKIHILYMMYC